MDAVGSDQDPLVAIALLRVRGAAAASERVCCVAGVVFDFFLAGASPPSAGGFTPDRLPWGSAAANTWESITYARVHCAQAEMPWLP